MYRILLTLILLAEAALVAAQMPMAEKDSAYYRIAILGCHRQFRPAPALVNYLEAEPDLCLWIGDNVYGDTEDDISYLAKCYDALAAKPAFQRLKGEIPYMATWDDHDFGLNNAGKEYSLKAQSKAMFREFWGLEKEIPAEQDGIYYAKKFEFGEQSLQIIMLDGRYNRDEPREAGDVLGEAQWTWLEAQLREPATIRLLVSGFQILLDRESGSETWAKFPQARARLFELIRKTQAEGVVFLTGDQHYGEVCRMQGMLDYDAIELQFAGLNQREDPEFNSFRVSPVADALNSYAMLDIQWEENEFHRPHLLFRVYDAKYHRLELSYRVNFEETKLKVKVEGLARFIGTQQIRLTHAYPKLNLHYTLDGSEPTPQSSLYTEPISISRTTELKLRFFDKSGFDRGGAQSYHFKQIQALASVSLKQKAKGFRYQYVEGEFLKVPDFSSLNPKKKGITQSLDLKNLAEREDHYALQFTGYVEVPADGLYTFYLRSDDGSMLYVHDELMIDNDGSHSTRRKEGMVALKKGLHPIRIGYFEDYEGQKLQVGYKLNNGDFQSLSFEHVYHKP